MKDMVNWRGFLGSGIAALVMTGGALLARGGELVIAEAAKPSSMLILVPEQASASQRFAAEELRDYVAKITGRSLAIATGAPRPGAIAFVSLPEPGKYGDDGYRITAKDGGLVIASWTTHGPLHAVYGFLEDHFGCEYLAPTQEIVPKRERMAVPDDFDDDQVPAFVVRDSDWWNLTHNPGFAVKLRINGTRVFFPEKLGGDTFTFDRWIRISHTFKKLVPKSHFKDHPEWFSEVNGRRTPNGQLCLSNPGLVAEATRALLERIREMYPKCKYYGVSQDDTMGYCTCPECRAIDEREGGPSGSIITFVNTLAEAVEKEFPDVVISTLAYLYSIDPPKYVRPRDNVMIVLCADQVDWSRPMQESRYKENVKFVKALDGWQRIAKKIKIWEYESNFRFHLHSYPCLDAMAANLKWYEKLGVDYVFEEGDVCGPHAELAEFRAWLAAHLMWKPDQPMEPLIDRFFGGYYGAGADAAKRYLQMMREYPHDETKFPLKMWGLIQNPFLTLEMFDRAAELWREAGRAVRAENDRVRLENIRWDAIATDYSRIMLGNEGAQVFAARDLSHLRSERFLNLRKSAQNIVARLDATKDGWKGISEDAARVTSRSRRKLCHLATNDFSVVKASDVGVIEDDILETGAASVGLDDNPDHSIRRTRDPEALDGTAIRFSPEAPDWSVNFYFDEFRGDPGAKYKVRARVRIEKSEDAPDGEAFWWGVWNIGDNYPSVRDIKVKVRDCGDGYQWYELGKAWVPRNSDRLFFGNGTWNRNASAGNPAFKAMWLDRFEVVRVEE